MEDVTLNTFPDSKLSALTMLYLQNQDLSHLTPEGILDKYDEVYETLKEYSKEKRKAHRANRGSISFK